MALPAQEFWFLRHGETDYNARGLSQGALDVPLNETGRAQAAAAAKILAGRGIARIVASPMLRTRETADIVNQALALPLAFEPDLREVVFGGMEGKPLMPWYLDWLAERYTPEGAERFTQVQARVAAVMPRVLAPPGPMLVVAHGGIFRVLRELMGLERGGGEVRNGAPLHCVPGPAGWKATPV